MDKGVMRNGMQPDDQLQPRISGAQCLVGLLEEKLGPQQQTQGLDALDSMIREVLQIQTQATRIY
eukprot:1589596-Amphidinium_carterae.1